MLEEAVEMLKVRPGGFYIDCTFGGGGYSGKIAELAGADGGVLAIDMDPLAIENSKKIFENKNIKNICLVEGNFGDIAEIASQNEFIKDKKIAGVVFDLGLSSAQIEDDSRGISFQKDRPLKMEFGDGFERYGGVSTEEIVNEWKQKDIERIIREYGEENHPKRIAAAIVAERLKERITSTGRLVEIIRNSVPLKYQHDRLHFATRTFQALRIATNNELENLKEALAQSLEVLAVGGRMAVVSYHSLEDRIVKSFFREQSLTCRCGPHNLVCNCEDVARLKIINKKIVLPSEGEVGLNPRARSAKLRVAEKIR